MTSIRPKKEAIVAASLFAFGIAVLPALIYGVGIVVIGPYEGELGLISLYQAIIQGIFNLDAAAWLLVLSPYVTIQLLRLAFIRRSPNPAVKRVTE